MNKLVDPRLEATRTHALEAALRLLQNGGLLAVTHGSVGRATGISRSTLYRHWPKVEDLRNAAIAQAATSPDKKPRTNGPLDADLRWIIGTLMKALNDTPWGKIAPQVIAAAATDDENRSLLTKWVQDRSGDVSKIFEEANARGEIADNVPVAQLAEMSISVPYFRKFIAGLPLDDAWLEAHIQMICGIARRAPTTAHSTAPVRAQKDG